MIHEPDQDHLDLATVLMLFIESLKYGRGQGPEWMLSAGFILELEYTRDESGLSFLMAATSLTHSCEECAGTVICMNEEGRVREETIFLLAKLFAANESPDSTCGLHFLFANRPEARTEASLQTSFFYTEFSAS